MSNAKNKHRNIRKGGHVKTVRYHDLLRAKRTQNPLSGLNPAKVRRLYELYREGKYADVQLAWEALEEYDDMLGTVLERRQAALGEMEWDVLIDARAVGASSLAGGSLSTPTQGLQELAEAQQDYIVRCLRQVENLSDAIKWLGLANFRRYSALEVVAAGNGERWLPIHHWLLCRPALEGAWCYNEHAETSCARVEPIDMSAVILREVARPIDLVAMFLISAKEAAIDGWDSFLEVFGNPALFFKMPPGTSDDQRDEYASIIKEISSDGAGVYPDGGEIHTVETSAANADAFSSRAAWCDKALVRRATGGLLTVLAESGSGTLAGSAHMEAFRQIAANDAISIAECINRQYVRRRIAAEFPGEPVLVYFTLTQPVINDRAATVNMLCQLAGQRWRATDEAVSEEVGVEVHTEPSTPQSGYAEPGEEQSTRLRLSATPRQANYDLRSENSAPAVPVMNSGETLPVVNSADEPGSESPSGRFLRRGDSASEEEDSVESPAESEPPLNEGELEALRLLGGGLNPEQVAVDAAFMAEAMKEDLRLTNDDLRVEHSAAAPQEEEEVVANSCNQYGHEEGCDGAGDDPSSPDDYAEAEEAAEERERREAEETERREREMDASSMESAGYTPEEIERVTGIKLADDEDVVTNGCNQYQHTPGCMKFAVLKKNKGSRSSGGKKMLGKTGSPNLIEAGDSKRKTKRALVKAFDKAKDGKKVSTGYKMGSHEVTLAPGDKKHWGTHHAERKEHPKKISSDKLAEMTMHAERKVEKRGSVTIREGDDLLVFAPENQPTKTGNEAIKRKQKGKKVVGKNWYRTGEK